MTNYWISWFAAKSPYTLHRPWWISGYRYLRSLDKREDVEQATICAAVKAENESAAKEAVRQVHDDPDTNIEWRFCEERPDDWTPFCDRFPRAKWMQWP